MGELIQVALSFPAVVFTILLAFVLLFWTTVFAGGADANSLDGDADLHGDADIHGADHHGDIHADHGHAGHDHADHGDSATPGVLSWLLNFMNVGSVPTSVLLTVLTLFGWTSTMLLQMYAGPVMASMMPAVAAATVILTASTIGSALATGMATKPLRGLLKIHRRHAEETIVDQICTIATTKVTGEFGQATFEKRGGAPFLLSVRCPRENKLKKGAKAVIVGYDPATNTYEVGELEPGDVRLTLAEAESEPQPARRRAERRTDLKE